MGCPIRVLNDETIFRELCINFVCYFVVPAEVKAQYEDNLKWIEEAQQHQLVLCLSPPQAFLFLSKRPAKRSQHVNATYCNIVGRLRAFGHPVAMCCDMATCWVLLAQV